MPIALFVNKTEDWSEVFLITVYRERVRLYKGPFRQAKSVYRRLKRKGIKQIGRAIGLDHVRVYPDGEQRILHAELDYK